MCDSEVHCEPGRGEGPNLKPRRGPGPPRRPRETAGGAVAGLGRFCAKNAGPGSLQLAPSRFNGPILLLSRPRGHTQVRSVSTTRVTRAGPPARGWRLRWQSGTRTGDSAGERPDFSKTGRPGDGPRGLGPPDHRRDKSGAGTGPPGRSPISVNQAGSHPRARPRANRGQRRRERGPARGCPRPVPGSAPGLGPTRSHRYSVAAGIPPSHCTQQM